MRNAEGYFVNKLVTKFPFEISDKCLELKEITLDDIKAYIEVKKDPHSRKDIGIAKWGGLLELHLYGLMNKKNVWLIRNWKLKETVVGYVTERIVSLRGRDHFSHADDISQDYDMFLYDQENLHCSPIAPTSAAVVPPRPVCQKVYGLPDFISVIYKESDDCNKMQLSK